VNRLETDGSFSVISGDKQGTGSPLDKDRLVIRSKAGGADGRWV
jgi:hypothetical protein